MAAPPFKVKAVYEYTSEHEDDLTFPIGQVITVTELEGDDWYVGEYSDVTGGKHEGLFPTNFVERYEPEVPTRPMRPARQKQETQQPPAPAQVAATEELEEEEEEEAPPVPAASKPTAPSVEIPPASSKNEEVRSPPSASSQQTPTSRSEPPSAPKPAPAEPVEAASAAAKKAPPPVAAKSNAFKDRIAAFNQPAAAPVAPMQPGRQAAPPSGFIKKPFVAPPPSKNAYIPPPTKIEPVHKPYVREEDPEIKQREEEDRAAAEAAGFTDEPTTATQAEEDEDAPKPMTLKERMAMLQKQQQEQAQRRAEAASQKKEKKTPQKKASESSEHAVPAEVETEELERVRSDTTERQSMDAPREKPRVPSAQRRPPEPMSPVPAPPEHEILSDGHEADQSGAGDLTEDDTGTLGQDDSDERSVEALRHPVAPREEPDVGDEEDTTEGDGGEEEEEVDEETRRKEELRARMARLGGGMPGMGAPFNPFGAPPFAPARKKQPSKEAKTSADAASASTQQPQQRIPMVPVPGMQRMQSPESDATQRVGERDVEAEEEEEDDNEEAPPPPPSRTSTLESRAPPPVPKGKSVNIPTHSRLRHTGKLHRSDSAVGLKHRAPTSSGGVSEAVILRRRLSTLQAIAQSRFVIRYFLKSRMARTTLTSVQTPDLYRKCLLRTVVLYRQSPAVALLLVRRNLAQCHLRRPPQPCHQVQAQNRTMKCRVMLSVPRQRRPELRRRYQYALLRRLYLALVKCRHGHHSHQRTSARHTLAAANHHQPARTRERVVRFRRCLLTVQ